MTLIRRLAKKYVTVTSIIGCSNGSGCCWIGRDDMRYLSRGRFAIYCSRDVRCEIMNKTKLYLANDGRAL